MGCSVIGQDDLNRALWLATRAGKMEPFCPLETTHCIPQAKLPRKPYNKSKCEVKMAGYWPRSFFASLWTSTSSPSLNTQKKNLANIQSSWPHTWSITHELCQLKNGYSSPTSTGTPPFFPVIVMTLSQALRKKRLIWFLLLKIE